MADSYATQAARIVSLTTAANCLLSRSSPADDRVTEGVVLDLMAVAGLLAAQLSSDWETLEAATH